MTAPAYAMVPYEPPVTAQALALDESQQAQTEAEQERDAALTQLYGDTFPLLSRESDAQGEAAWVAWAQQLWKSREAAMVKPLWIAQRNREFWQGNHWIDSTGVGRRWESPRAPSDAVRMVCNVTRSALNLRAQIVSEQRPGFKIEPTNRDSQTKKKAEAKQLALNYAWKESNMEAITSEAARWSGTDGVAFVETYWDNRAGPWHEMLSQQRMQLGDVRHRVLRIDEWRVSPNATATVRPDWGIARRDVPTSEAVATWGAGVAGQSAEDGQLKGLGNQSALGFNDAGRQDDRFYDTPTLEEFAVYVEPGDYLPNGLELHCVGQKVTYLGKLLFGRVPIARYTDGSKDPSYYPEPEMNNWVSDQVSINIIISKMVEVIRKTAGGAFLARPQTITSETKMFGGVSLVEVQGTAALKDLVEYLPPGTVGPDAMALLAFQLQQFEQKSGWNDATRGSFKADTSGRAILAIREQVERTFMPIVGAFARGACEWAKNTLAAMAWGYELPREIAITGSSRVDLARLITAEDLDGVSDVDVSPETLMPMPRSLKLMIMDQDLARGLIPPDQFLRLRPYGSLEDLGNGDEDDRARANRIADMIRREMQPLPPVLFMDNAAVHMDVLRREVLLNDDLPDQVRAVAYDRWMQYMQIMQMQQPPAPMESAQGSAPGGKPPQFSPQSQPLMQSRPPVAAAPLSLDPSEEGTNGRMADALQPL